MGADKQVEALNCWQTQASPVISFELAEADHAEGIKRDENQSGARTSHNFQADAPTRVRRPPQVEQARFAHVHRPASLPIYSLSPPNSSSSSSFLLHPSAEVLRVSVRIRPRSRFC